MAFPGNPARSAGASDRALELGIGLIMIVLAFSVWAYTQLGAESTQHKPRPIWLGISKVMAQMGDGRMVNMKVNLRLQDDDALDSLSAHVPAFKALIETTGAQMSRDTLQGREGMHNLGTAIRDTLNNYLDDHAVKERVKDVAFEELMLMP